MGRSTVFRSRPDEFLVEQTLRGIDRPGDSVEVAITALRVEGQVLRSCRDRYQTRAGDHPTVRHHVGRSGAGVGRSGAALLRPTRPRRSSHLQRYEVVSRDGSDPYQSPRATKTDNGETMRAYYYYAAPEEGVHVLDVVLSDAYPAFTDVPVGR